MVDDPPMERRAIRSARKTIIESFARAARERGSLGIRFMTTYGKQLIRVHEANSDGTFETKFQNYDGTLIRIREMLFNGNYREFCVDYYGTVHSDEIDINQTKLVPSKRLINARFRIDEITDLWNRDLKSDDDFEEESWERIRVESHDLPTEVATVFRICHHRLLIGFFHSDALQLTRWSRRKTIHVTEAHTESANRLHTIDEIAQTTFAEASARYGGGAIPNKIQFDILRRLKWVERGLISARSDLL